VLAPPEALWSELEEGSPPEPSRRCSSGRGVICASVSGPRRLLTGSIDMTCAHVLGLIDAGPFADYPRAHLESAWRHARQCATCGPAMEAATSLTMDLSNLPQGAGSSELTTAILAHRADGAGAARSCLRDNAGDKASLHYARLVGMGDDSRRPRRRTRHYSVDGARWGGGDQHCVAQTRRDDWPFGRYALDDELCARSRGRSRPIRRRVVCAPQRA